MAVLPTANVTLDDTAGTFAGGDAYCVVMACVGQNADITPRVFTSTKAILAQHLYSPGVDYCAQHFEKTRKPIIFIGLPIVTAGAVGQQNSTGVLGTSVISIAAGAQGFLEETQASIKVVNPGTIGVSGITFNLSLDGGATQKLIRLGTANSYTVPYVGIVINFGAGTLLANDTYTFVTSPPLWDQTGLNNAKVALEAQQKATRSWMVIGDISTSLQAGYVTTIVNAYQTEAQRCTYARVQLRDRIPVATKSKVLKTMVGAPSLTFAAAGFTVTRATGSFLTEGWQVGDVVTFSGTTLNNFTKPLTAVTATVMTFASTVVNEGPIGTAQASGSEGLTFAAAGFSITRTQGSFLADGFNVGDTVTISGTVSNNQTRAISALSATVMSFAAGIVNEGPLASTAVTIVKGETMSQWISNLDGVFNSVDAQVRVDLGVGRGRYLSPITGWYFRRPVQWAASVREYAHDLQIPCWRKSDGPLDGWSLEDVLGNNTIAEYDERAVGGALAARFTCFRTYGNGPRGAFIALSLTRATEGSLLSRTHNLAVANMACNISQAETENAIGQVLVLNNDGTGTDASLALIEGRVNTQLQNNLLKAGPEGPRASSAVWKASRTDVLNIPGATLTGTVDLRINGTLEQINTSVRVLTAG